MKVAERGWVLAWISFMYAFQCVFNVFPPRLCQALADDTRILPWQCRFHYSHAAQGTCLLNFSDHSEIFIQCDGGISTNAAALLQIHHCCCVLKPTALHQALQSDVPTRMSLCVPHWCTDHSRCLLRSVKPKISPRKFWTSSKLVLALHACPRP